MGIDKYKSELSEKDYLDLLAEIESDDDAAQEDLEAAEKEAALADAQFEIAEEPDGHDEAEAKRLRMEVYWANIREDKKRIQREAFNQDLLPLHRLITDEEMQKLVELITMPSTQFVERQAAYINRRFAYMLRPYIPAILRSCYKRFPQCVREHPGFLYKTFSQDEVLSFWATPKIPAFFDQGDETTLLMEQKAEMLQVTDMAIYKYHTGIMNRNKQETRIAYKLTASRVRTFFDLVRVNPFWFNLIFKHLTQREL